MSATQRVLVVGATGYLGTRILRVVPGAYDNPVIAPGIALDVMQDHIRRDAPSVVVNAAGARQGDLAGMQAGNIALPTALASVCDEIGAHLVHLGSAAEYGTGQPDGWCTEAAEPRPEADYGRSKLAGTRAVLEAKSSTVLRVFNLAAEPPQQGSPLADVVSRTASAVSAGTAVRLYSPGTVRDWVSPSFVTESVARAVELRARGLFNLCSGIGVAMGDAVMEALRTLGSEQGVVPGAPAGGPVVGDPRRWAEVGGLREQVTAEVLGDVIARSASALLS